MVNCIKGFGNMKVDINWLSVSPLSMSVMILSINSNAANSVECFLIEIHTDGQTEVCFPLNQIPIDHISVSGQPYHI